MLRPYLQVMNFPRQNRWLDHQKSPCQTWVNLVTEVTGHGFYWTFFATSEERCQLKILGWWSSAFEESVAS